MDKLTPEQRHKCMSHIRGKNTKPEIIVRKYLFSHGYRYRINVKRLPGTPDIVLRKYRTVIFINGCFWHGHEGCRYFVLPKSNTEFWEKKIRRNQERDMQERIQLRQMGWHTIIIWECQLKPKTKDQTLESLVYTLNKIFIENQQQSSNKYRYLPKRQKSSVAAEKHACYIGKQSGEKEPRFKPL